MLLKRLNITGLVKKVNNVKTTDASDLVKKNLL